MLGKCRMDRRRGDHRDRSVSQGRRGRAEVFGLNRMVEAVVVAEEGIEEATAGEDEGVEEEAPEADGSRRVLERLGDRGIWPGR